MNEPLARGWATVDLERAIPELDGARAPDSPFERAERSKVLGARCVRASAADGGWTVIMEPDTEGPIAAFLARHGEGWAATWLADDDDRPSSTPSARALPGPLGPERLEPGLTSGPFQLRVMPATIRR